MHLYHRNQNAAPQSECGTYTRNSGTTYIYHLADLIRIHAAAREILQGGRGHLTRYKSMGFYASIHAAIARSTAVMLRDRLFATADAPRPGPRQTAADAARPGPPPIPQPRAPARRPGAGSFCPDFAEAAAAAGSAGAGDAAYASKGVDSCTSCASYVLQTPVTTTHAATSFFSEGTSASIGLRP